MGPRLGTDVARGRRADPTGPMGTQASAECAESVPIGLRRPSTGSSGDVL
jgi:hypothetical protein